MQSEMEVAPRWEAEGVEEGEGLEQWHICLYIYIYCHMVRTPWE